MERNTLAAGVFANSNIYAKHNLQVLVQNALEVFPDDNKIRKLVGIFLNICETNYFMFIMDDFINKWINYF